MHEKQNWNFSGWGLRVCQTDPGGLCDNSSDVIWAAECSNLHQLDWNTDWSKCGECIKSTIYWCVFVTLVLCGTRCPARPAAVLSLLYCVYFLVGMNAAVCVWVYTHTHTHSYIWSWVSITALSNCPTLHLFMHSSTIIITKLNTDNIPQLQWSLQSALKFTLDFSAKTPLLYWLLPFGFSKFFLWKFPWIIQFM